MYSFLVCGQACLQVFFNNTKQLCLILQTCHPLSQDGLVSVYRQGWEVWECAYRYICVCVLNLCLLLVKCIFAPTTLCVISDVPLQSKLQMVRIITYCSCSLSLKTVNNSAAAVYTAIAIEGDCGFFQSMLISFSVGSVAAVAAIMGCGDMDVLRSQLCTFYM